MSTAADRRAYRGPALFSFGFRPFFLSAGVWAALTVPLWLTARIGLMPPSGIDRVWHAHEMLFGYLAAVVAGFLLTAVPNWTGRIPVLGRPLAALWALWLAGRLAMVTPWALSPWAWGLDSLFLLVFAGVIWREILSGRNWRNLGVAAMVSLLALAHLAFHLLPEASVPAAERAAVALAATLIALIGGRVTPSFTRNWLAPRGEADAVRTRPRTHRFFVMGAPSGLVAPGGCLAPFPSSAGPAAR